MWIAPVQAAAPVPGAAPAAAPPREAPLFDAALEASLVDEAEEAAVPVFDQRALIGWLLVGSPVDAATETPAAVEAAPSETEADDEDPELVAEVEGDAGLEIPADMLLVAPAAPPQPVTVQTIEIPVEAAGQHPGEPHTASQLETEAAPRPDTPENRDAMLGAEPSAPQDRSAGASAPGTTQAVAGARFVAGNTMPAPAVAVVAEPIATTESAAAPAAEAAPVVVQPPQNGERETRDTTTAGMPRVTVQGPGIAKLETQMGGGDAQGFEQGRQSPAAQRLAAALATMAPQARSHETGAGLAPPPVFAVAQPPAPPAPIAPVAVTAPPVTTPEVDVENVHSLVQAMRVTAKAGGWEATVRLKPEHLGEVTISLRVDGKNVSAVVQAESAGVRQWLMAQEDAVRSGLSEQGLQLDWFAVSRDGQRREAEQQPQEERRHRRAPRQAATGNEPRFEVVV